MIAVVSLLFLQAGSQPPGPAATSPTANAPLEDPAPQTAKPKVICTMEPVTGTRARKREVCQTPGYLKGAERSKEMMRQIQGGSGNVQPSLPKGIGG